MNRRSIVLKTLTALVLLAAPLASLAGTPPPGGITFSPVDAGFPGSVDIPTMGGIGLLLMAMVLGAVAVNHIRSAGGHLSAFLVAGLTIGALAGSLGGVGLISQSQAQAGPGEFTITNPDGETLDILFGQFNEYTNGSGVSQTVTDITPPERCPTPGGPTTCQAGQVLEDGSFCDYDCSLQNESQEQAPPD